MQIGIRNEGMKKRKKKSTRENYDGRESSMRRNFRKHMQIEKTPANQENIFISLTADGENAHNTSK